MILIVGANAAINSRIIPHLNNSDIAVVGRSEPDYFKVLKQEGIGLKFFKTDYTNAAEVVAEIGEISSITVIFAGIASIPSLILNLESQQVRNELLLNLEFSILMTSILLPKMILNGFGRFIFLGSQESSRGAPGGAMYSIIKQAQIGLSRSVAVEYAKFGITSNVLRLGLLSEGYSKELPSKEIEKLRLRIPTTRFLDYKDIAAQICTLIQSPSINGTIIDIDQAVR